MKHLALALLTFLFYSCSTADKKYEMKIDVDRAFNQKKEVKLSSVVKNLEYIPLETDSNSLLDENLGILLFDKEIVAINKRKCLLFDRATGKFIKEVLRREEGPDGYSSTTLGFGMLGNESEKNIFFNEFNGKVAVYSLETGERNRIPNPEFGSVAYVDKHTMVCTAMNWDGTKKVKMRVYKDYQYVDSIPNKENYELKTNAVAIFTDEDLFYRTNGKTYYKYMINDTVYEVTDKALLPVYTFAPTEKLPQLELREHPETMGKAMDELYVVKQIMEDNDYILYQIEYEKEKHFLLYDKEAGEGCRLDEGFTDDIDGGVNLWPDHITEKGEYVFIVNPALLEEDMLAKYNLQEDDNPLIIVGTK